MISNNTHYYYYCYAPVAVDTYTHYSTGHDIAALMIAIDIHRNFYAKNHFFHENETTSSRHFEIISTTNYV